MLPAEFKAGKLQAYKLICEMMTRNQDVLPNSDFLVHLYHVMHKGFTSVDQVIFCFILSRLYLVSRRVSCETGKAKRKPDEEPQCLTHCL